MKNQFVGDINDYYKYGLLRILSGFGKKKLGVCWMLTADTHPGKLGLIGYLRHPEKWRRYDRDLFDALRKIVLVKKTRKVAKIKEAEILPSARFFPNPLPRGSGQRERYFKEMFENFKGVDLLFLDPDVGLVPPGRASLPSRHDKWVYFDEVARASEKKLSVFLIQFFRVPPNPDEVAAKIRQIQEITSSTEIYNFQAGKVAFFLATQPRHADYFRRQAKRVERQWGDRIDVARDPCMDRSPLEGSEGGQNPKGGAILTVKSVYAFAPVKLDRVRTYPLRSRRSKVSVKEFARAPRAAATVAQLLDSLPRILAGYDFREVVERLRRARRKRKPIIWGLGGHVIKVGLAPVLIDLLRRGYVTAVAMNGAALIHDFEIALAGQTSEDVPAVLGRGQFGMAEETGRFINEAIVAGDRDGLGIGEAAGRFLARSRGARYRRFSLLAAAYRARVPVTVHEAIGTDIIHNHPAVDPRALGAATHRDFRLLAAIVKRMDGGGVYLNVGSAVMLPEVFLKCFSLVANLGRAPRGITTVNLDFIQHYRPTQNVVLRPTAAPGSRGFALTGHHEILLPLLAAALSERRRAR
jgi:hypothetical protein